MSSAQVYGHERADKCQLHREPGGECFLNVDQRRPREDRYERGRRKNHDVKETYHRVQAMKVRLLPRLVSLAVEVR